MYTELYRQKNIKMTDIFDAKIMCKHCNVQMKPRVLEKDGLQLRAVECPKCKDKIVHPADLNCQNHFNDLKGKTFNVKLRMVGNSHAVSIPKEIVDLMNEQHKLMNERHRRMSRDVDEMVRLAFEDFGKLSLNFLGEDFDGDGDRDEEIDNAEHESLNDEENGIKIHKMKIKKLRREYD